MDSCRKKFVGRQTIHLLGPSSAAFAWEIRDPSTTAHATVLHDPNYLNPGEGNMGFQENEITHYVLSAKSKASAGFEENATHFSTQTPAPSHMISYSKSFGFVCRTLHWPDGLKPPDFASAKPLKALKLNQKTEM